MQRFGLTLLLGLFAVSLADSDGSAYELRLKEASGVTAVGDTLFLVGDDNPGRLFKLPIPDTTVRVFAPDPDHLIEVPLPGAELAVDLEAIDVLADGRIVVLSEDLTALVGPLSSDNDVNGLIARYPPAMNEFGNRGVEGLAVRSANGGSEVAVLWEGGYGYLPLIPFELQPPIGHEPLKPVVIIHPIPNDSTVGWVSHDNRLITLNPPEPPGEVPDALRYRGADLVWHQWQDADSTVDGFIVVIAASNSPKDNSPTHLTGELQRFDLHGEPVGDPIDLHAEALRLLNDAVLNQDDRLPDSLAEHMQTVHEMFAARDEYSANFEGLGWSRPGEQLVVVFDGYPTEPTLVFFIDVPEAWK
ncbi:MAG: hypothetical protein GF341_07265 [candidate division Zixibacteria bacterium]|nr:hypothetical protein [candidate division Zixibacteria bacterium]